MFKLYKGKVKLDVTAQSPLDEVFLIDSGLRRIARGLGGLEVKDLVPGIYKLKFKSGDAVLERPLFLNEAHVKVTGDSIQLPSAVPMDPVTSTPAAPSVEAPPPAVRVRKSKGRTATKPAVNKIRWKGKGSGLYLYLTADNTSSARRIVKASRLINEKGEEMRADCDSPTFSQAIDCAPGKYILRVDAGEVGVLDMCLTASPGWRTSVFMPVREVGYHTPVQVPDVSNAGILLCPLHAPLNHADQNLRWTEQARLALAAGRPVAPKEQFARLLSQDWDQPMYLLLGAHLLLLESPVDQPLLDRLVNRLRSLLPDHQDVELLELYSRKAKSPPPPRLSLRWPPMLAHTWRLLDDPFMRDRVEIVPDSMAATAMRSPITGSTWLMWRSQAATRR